MDYLAENLAGRVQFSPQGIVSSTIVDQPFTKVVLFTFDKGQSLSEHTASVPAVIHILEGTGRVLLGDDWHDCSPGSWYYMAAGLNHAIEASSQLVMLLTLYKSQKVPNVAGP